MTAQRQICREQIWTTAATRRGKYREVFHQSASWHGARSRIDGQTSPLRNARWDLRPLEEGHDREGHDSGAEDAHIDTLQGQTLPSEGKGRLNDSLDMPPAASMMRTD
jgi:hypothetical protein